MTRFSGVMPARFSGLTPARRAGFVGVLAVILLGVFTSGWFVVGALAAAGLPAPVITSSPSNPTASSSAAFTFTNSQAGVNYRCALDSASFAACASGVTYSRLTRGSHSFRVEAMSGSKISTATSYTWQVGTTGVAAPVITSGPTSPSTDTSPEFIFTDTDWPHVAFTCWLDSGKHMDCAGDTDHDRNPTVEGEWQFSNLALGSHCFSVYATNGTPHTSPTTEFCWTIGTGAKNFAVGGSLTTPLYPGTSLPLNMTFTNPGSLPITIASGGVSASNITITSNAPGCASSNFAVAQGLIVAVTIPGNQLTPTSLSALGVPQADWPVIKMIDTNTNQDACQGAKLTLTYSGIEASG